MKRQGKGAGEWAAPRLPGLAILAAFFALGCLPAGAAQPKRKVRPYRLPGVNLRQPIIWGSRCEKPAGSGLAFGGQDQRAEDGRPHTRLKSGGTWKAIHQELRARNPLQKLHDQAWALRNQQKEIVARARYLFFEGRPAAEEAKRIQEVIAPRQKKFSGALATLQQDLQKAAGGKQGYEAEQARFALAKLQAAAPLAKAMGETVTAPALQALRRVQILLAQAAEALDAEPPPRALSPVVYDPQTKRYVIFGGDHFDYLTNDTWVFDPQKQQWRQRHPKIAPDPRAQYPPPPKPGAKVPYARRAWPKKPYLKANGNGTLTLSGGYRYTSNTGYTSGQYADVGGGDWTYDVRKNTWTNAGGVAGVPPDTRVYRTGPFDPDFFLRGSKPDAAANEARLKKIPPNTWVLMNPPQRPSLNRDWGTAVMDPDHDLMLRWSGGHSAHGGTDVPHYHFATNRWELPYPIEFPLGQLYSNTGYPSGFNFNLRPWITGHTYLNYAYDPVLKKMLFTGRSTWCYLYDPSKADWVARVKKPKGMIYRGCFYSLTCTATPKGVVCWTAHGRVYRFDAKAGRWKEIKLQGEKLPGAVVDNSTLAHDGKRKRVLFIRKGYGAKNRFNGQVYAMDLASGTVTALSPKGMDKAAQIPGLDRGVFDPENDLWLLATALAPDEKGVRRMPAFDCANNRWVGLKVKFKAVQRGRRTYLSFPSGHSAGLMYDAKRKLIWGTDTNSQVYVLRLDLKRADPRPLQ